MNNTPEYFGIKDYKTNSDGSINVYQNVDMSCMDLVEIPIKFNIVEGSFNIRQNHLNSLKNSPKEVFGDFDCSHNIIKSLKDGPIYVLDSYRAHNNSLTEINSKFECGFNLMLDFNRLEKLDSIQEYIEGSLSLSHNKLKTLKGSPKEIETSFYVSKNNLYSLQGCPQTIGCNFEFSHNKVIDLYHFPEKIGGSINMDYNDLYELPSGYSILNMSWKYNNITEEILDPLYEIELKKDPYLLKSIKDKVSEKLVEKYKWVIDANKLGL